MTPTATQLVQLPAGPIAVADGGARDGATGTVVFLHGLLVSGTLWRNVTPPLEAAGLRTIVPTLPLGAHQHPMRPDADLTPPGLARLVADLLAELDLADVTLVANDTGGAIAQLVAARHPERLGRLVLTSCDTFERFLPPLFTPLVVVGGRVPGAIAALAALFDGVKPLRRSPLAFGLLSKRPIPEAVVDAWIAPLRRDAAVRRDARKVLRGVDKRHTLAAAEELRAFDRPVLLPWPSEERRVFPIRDAYRLAERLPHARVEEIADSYAFVPEDQPARLAELIAAFVRPAPGPAARPR